jgi:hypothetical protein
VFSPLDNRYPTLNRATLCEHAIRFGGDRGFLDIADQDDLQVLHPDLLDAWTPEGMAWLPGAGSIAAWDEKDLWAVVRGRLWIDGKPVGRLNREISTAKGFADHGLFWLEDGAPTGQHFGGRQMRRSVEAYQRIGVPEVRITATYLGRYVWSRCGFAFQDPGGDGTAAANFANEATQLLIALGKIDASDALPPLRRPVDYLALNGPEGDPNVVTPRQIQTARDALDADPGLVPPIDRVLPLGAAVLLYAPVAGWDCVLDVASDTVGIEDLARYTGCV